MRTKKHIFRAPTMEDGGKIDTNIRTRVGHDTLFGRVANNLESPSSQAVEPWFADSRHSKPGDCRISTTDPQGSSPGVPRPRADDGRLKRYGEGRQAVLVGPCANCAYQSLFNAGTCLPVG